MLTYGLLGRDQDRSRPPSIASSTPGAARASAPSNRTRVDLVAVAAGDEPLLEGEAARRRVDPGAEPVVGGRQDRRLDPERAREPGGDGGERLAGAQRLRADEVEAEVAVAEPEPVLAAERRDRAERLPGLARPAPAALLVVQAGERVEDAVEVGRDVRARAPRGRRRRCRRPSGRRGRRHRRGRARSARRRRRRRGGRPSRPPRRCRAPPASSGRRGGATRCEVVERVDVVAEIGDRAAIAVTPMRRACSRKRRGAAAAVERREERPRRQRERVRRPVRAPRRAERAELGGAGERAEIVRDDARAGRR